MPKGKEHWSYKHDDRLSYRGLHLWVVTALGQPTKCESCGLGGLTGRKIHWANISREYKRIVTDWARLCAKCHKAFDTGRLTI